MKVRQRRICNEVLFPTDITTTDAYNNKIIIRDIRDRGDGPYMYMGNVYDVHHNCIGPALARVLKPMIDKLAAME